MQMTAHDHNRKSMNSHHNLLLQPPPPKHRRHSRFLLLTIAMATIFSISIFSLLLLSSLSSAANHHHHHHRHQRNEPSKSSEILPEILKACNATRYPGICTAQLAQSTSTQNLPPNPSSTQIIQSALSVSNQNLKKAQYLIRRILLTSASNHNRTRTAKVCLEVLESAARRSSAAADAFARRRVADARAWGSAALCYQYDCWSGLKYVNGTRKVSEAISFLNNTLIVSTSNALSMMLAHQASRGNDTASWVPPRTERDGFWIKGEEEGNGGFGGGEGFWKEMAVNVTVCKEVGRCNYQTVQAAVDAADEGPLAGERFVVYIKEGVYKETVRIGFDKRNVVFIGDGMGRTVITDSLNTGVMGITTYNTATVGVLGDGFMAYGLTIENTAGANAYQAVAFRSDSDLSYIENCEFIGNQDTLYAHSLRQLYRSCRIVGNVDFIFGNSASVFQDCTILIQPRQLNPEKGETNAITAHGRTDPAQSTGFSFLGCWVNGTEDYMKLYYSNPGSHYNFLGRPWKDYSRIVFIGCTLGDVLHPEGWLPWSGDFALSTLYFGEYGNVGPGSRLDKRVPWSSRIPFEHIGAYSIKNFIQGDEFLLPTSASLLSRNLHSTS